MSTRHAQPPHLSPLRLRTRGVFIGLAKAPLFGRGGAQGRVDGEESGGEWEVRGRGGGLGAGTAAAFAQVGVRNGTRAQANGWVRSEPRVGVCATIARGKGRREEKAERKAEAEKDGGPSWKIKLQMRAGGRCTFPSGPRPTSSGSGSGPLTSFF